MAALLCRFVFSENYMNNFDFLTKDKQFDSFSYIAVAAERTLHLDPPTSAINCRRAMESAIKWMYSVDRELDDLGTDRLVTLMNARKFRDIVGSDIWRRMDYIRRIGNTAAHADAPIRYESALLCLENLFVFLDFIAYCYADKYTKRKFVRPTEGFVDANSNGISDYLEVDIGALASSDISSRRLYVESSLEDAGWKLGGDAVCGYRPDSRIDDTIDYAMMSDDGRVLALVELELSQSDYGKGRERASLFAEYVESKSGYRPTVFLTNGFEFYLCSESGEREISSLPSRRDLERIDAVDVELPDEFVDDERLRYYQNDAAEAVLSAFADGRRSALVSMASGSGKTRVAASVALRLIECGRVKNALFLSEREELYAQALREFREVCGDVSVSDISSDSGDFSADCVFSTYRKMSVLIDSAEDKLGRIFTSGHFDIVICDEVDGAVYFKNRDVIRYFDALTLGLTATPEDELGREICGEFECVDDSPTYVYSSETALDDGYLCGYGSVEEDLRSSSNSLDDAIFDDGAVKRALSILFDKALRESDGQVGKTLIFAKNHTHAEKILRALRDDFPELSESAELVDSMSKSSDKPIREFSRRNGGVRVMISSDLFDAGFDVPDLFNVVFMRRVYSRVKFRQMIGRGARRCDAVGKERFCVFDFCGNFEFFRLAPSDASQIRSDIGGVAFGLKIRLIRELQGFDNSHKSEIEFRTSLVNEAVVAVKSLDRSNFAVKQHLDTVAEYSEPKGYSLLSADDVKLIHDELCPLVMTRSGDVRALQFDIICHSLELSMLKGKKLTNGVELLKAKARGFMKVSRHKKVKPYLDRVRQILREDFPSGLYASDIERIRRSLRNIVRYIPK